MGKGIPIVETQPTMKKLLPLLNLCQGHGGAGANPSSHLMRVG